VTFLGWEVGNRIMTGGSMTNNTPETNPCRRAYIDHQGPGRDRQSWDPATTLFAVRGNSEAFYTLHASGANRVSESDGTNVWHDGGFEAAGPSQQPKVARSGKPMSVPIAQAYLALAVDPGKVAAVIDSFLNEPPKPR
jgi:hypothetical protein